MDPNPNDPLGTPSGSTGGARSNPKNTGAAFNTGGVSDTGSTGAGGSFERADTVAGREYADAGADQATGLGARAREAREAAGEKLADARDTASEKLTDARETASEKLGEAHRKAHDLKLSFADKLDAQAERLRARGAAGSPTYATAGEGMSALSTNDAVRSRVSDKMAGGMHSTADWLRHNDLDSMKRNVEEQVRTNPGRSLLVAAVAGYLIGKALRRR
jgi:ElaB/YqjD/DUF883 family membrane-anchored ribosome-binding protein